MTNLNDATVLRIMLEVIGGPRARLELKRSAMTVEEVAAAEAKLALATDKANKRTFVQNQLMFTGRRLMFYLTLGAIGVAAAVMKMGFSYQNTMQQARVSLQPVIKDTATLNLQMNKLFRLAALSPFSFQDVTTAFTNLYKSFKVSGSGGLNDVNRLLQDVGDSLSAVPGAATEANLKRVTVAFQHMLNLGRPTGRLFYQLSTLGIPIEAILKRQLHLTDFQLRNIARSGLTAKQVLVAFEKFVEKTPGYKNMALITQTKTLQGAWSSLKDFMSQASGGASTGVFGMLQKTLAGVDLQLSNITKSGKAATLSDVARAFDKQLSPKTHLVMNVFVMFNTIIWTLIHTFGFLFKVVGLVVWVLDKLLGWMHLHNIVAKIMGFWLGILIALWGIAKVRVMWLAFWKEINNIRDWQSIKVIKGLIFWEKVQLYWTKALTRAKLLGAEASTALALADWAAIGPIAAVILAFVAVTAAIIYLYFKWKWFHNFVKHHPVFTLMIIGLASMIFPLATFGLTIVFLIAHWKALWNSIKGTVVFIKNNWRYFEWAKVMVGPLIDAVNLVKSLVGWIRKLIELVKHPIRMKFGFGGSGGGSSIAASILDHLNPLGPAARLPFFGRYLKPSTYLHKIGAHAAGGTTISPGLGIVGERGPELTYMPQGASVIPLNRQNKFNLSAEIIQPIKLVLDGRTLAESNARYRVRVQAAQ